MRILIYGLNYSPELTGIGKYNTEMAESLSAFGHDVRVVCAPPYYPAWRVSDGYSAWSYSSEHEQGVDILRAPLWVPRKPRASSRLAHLASFAVSSLPVTLAQARWRPDFVMVIAPSLFCAPAALACAQICGAISWLHIQDFEVDAAFGLGMLSGGPLRRAALQFERRIISQFDVVSTISNKMLERAASKGVDNSKLFHLPNWVDTSLIQPAGRGGSFREELALCDDTTVVLYSGSMGAKQGLGTLAEAARYLASRPDIAFVMCGDGPARADLYAGCAGLSHCRFLPLQPQERLSDLLSLADIHVLPQRSGAADLVMPSKLTGMFASGRAIVAMADRGTEVFDVVSGRGLVVPPEEATPLVGAIEALADDKEQRAALGRAARAYAVSTLSRDAILRRLDEKLTSLQHRRAYAS